MKVAVVGAGGQVGGILFKRLADNPDVSVIGVVRNEFTASPLVDAGFDIRVGSIEDADSCNRLLGDADIVVNSALALGLPKASRLTNQLLLANLISLPRRPVIVHLSTVAVYGSCLDARRSTFDHPQPDATYGREKLRLERFARATGHRNPGSRVVVVRLGHVYGPGQGWSKEFFTLLRTQPWSLPFDGALSSNAVHVYRVADAIPALYRTTAPFTTANATDEPQSTWRELFDLHARAADLDALPGMADELSEALRAQFQRRAGARLSRRFAGEIGKWLTSLRVQKLVDGTALRELGNEVLLRLPSSFEKKVYVRYQRFSAAKHLGAAAAGTTALLPPPWFFSDPAPGFNLIPVARTADLTPDSQQAALCEWFRSFSEPRWRIAAF